MHYLICFLNDKTYILNDILHDNQPSFTQNHYKNDKLPIAINRDLLHTKDEFIKISKNDYDVDIKSVNGNTDFYDVGFWFHFDKDISVVVDGVNVEKTKVKFVFYKNLDDVKNNICKNNIFFCYKTNFLKTLQLTSGVNKVRRLLTGLYL